MSLALRTILQRAISSAERQRSENDLRGFPQYFHGEDFPLMTTGEFPHLKDLRGKDLQKNVAARSRRSYLAVATFAKNFQQLKIMRRDSFSARIHCFLRQLHRFDVPRTILVPLSFEEEPSLLLPRLGEINTGVVDYETILLVLVVLFVHRWTTRLTQFQAKQRFVKHYSKRERMPAVRRERRYYL